MEYQDPAGFKSNSQITSVSSQIGASSAREDDIISSERNLRTLTTPWHKVLYPCTISWLLCYVMLCLCSVPLSANITSIHHFPLCFTIATVP